MLADDFSHNATEILHRSAKTQITHGLVIARTDLITRCFACRARNAQTGVVDQAAGHGQVPAKSGATPTQAICAQLAVKFHSPMPCRTLVPWALDPAPALHLRSPFDEILGLPCVNIDPKHTCFTGQIMFQHGFEIDAAFCPEVRLPGHEIKPLNTEPTVLLPPPVRRTGGLVRRQPFRKPVISSGYN